MEEQDDLYIEDNEIDNENSFLVPDENTYSYSKAVKKEFDNAFPTEYKEFTEEDYKTLYANILLYKEGNTEAAQYIISVFHRFIKKYTDFICYGDLTECDAIKYRKQYDKSLTKFVGLFIPKVKKVQATSTLEKNKLFSEACAKIQNLFSKYEYWDIYNELTCTLLNMANKYKITKEGDLYHKVNGTFHMYVNKCFHFDAYNALTKIIGDPLAHLEVYSLSDDCSPKDNGIMKYGIKYEWKSSEENVSATDIVGKNVVLKDTDTDKIIEHMMVKADRQKALTDSDKLVINETTKESDPYEMASLNFNWTNGSTCSEMFKVLTAYEREILVLSFVQNKTDSEIASLYGCHRITIIKHKKIAVNKISNSMKKI